MGGIGSGGSREGACRKTSDGEQRTKISITLPTGLLNVVRSEAEMKKISSSKLIAELIIKGI